MDRCNIDSGRMVDQCGHKTGKIIDRQQYEGQKWETYVCDTCGDVVLATADGLEKRGVKRSVPSKEITAYMMYSNPIVR